MGTLPNTVQLHGRTVPSWQKRAELRGFQRFGSCCDGTRGRRKAGYQASEGIQGFWDKATIKRTPAEWALQWVWNHPEVSVALSGMSTFEQVKENVESANISGANMLTGKELSIISQVRRRYKRLGFIGCTGCRYCMSCPEGVNVPERFSFYNEYYVRNRDDEIKRKYLGTYHARKPS